MLMSDPKGAPHVFAATNGGSIQHLVFFLFGFNCKCNELSYNLIKVCYKEYEEIAILT